MLIGVPKETKAYEYRVGLTPSSVREMVAHGHDVLVQRGTGTGISASVEDYKRARAVMVDTIDEVFARAEMIVKVKEPQPAERALLREGKYCSPTCISRRTPSRPATSWQAAPCVSRMRPLPHRPGDCHCSLQCPRSPAAWLCKRVRAPSKRNAVEWESCLEAFPACLQRRSWS